MGDKLQPFANGRVAQHPVGPLGLGYGVQRQSTSGGSSILISLSLLNGLPHLQALISDHFEIRSPGGRQGT